MAREKSLWEIYTDKQRAEMENLCICYKDCLNRGKTERECVNVIVNMAEEAGYVELSERLKDKKAVKKGDKVYTVEFKVIPVNDLKAMIDNDVKIENNPFKIVNE